VSSEKVIVRKEKGGRSLLVFPDRQANEMHIECWSPLDGHTEAALDYVIQHTHPDDCPAIIELYQSVYHVAEPLEVVVAANNEPFPMTEKLAKKLSLIMWEFLAAHPDCAKEDHPQYKMFHMMHGRCPLCSLQIQQQTPQQRKNRMLFCRGCPLDERPGDCAGEAYGKWCDAQRGQDTYDAQEAAEDILDQIVSCKVYQATLGLLINDKGLPNFVGLEEGANLYQVVEGKIIPLSEVDDAFFSRLMKKLVQTYIKHNADLCIEHDVSS